MCRILLTLFLGLVVGVPAWAQTPDPIQGCINGVGRLRVVTDTGLCRPKETGITWPSTQPTAPAPPARFQLVGFSTQPFQVGRGILALNETCRADFSGSRACTRAEILETTEVASGLSGIAWYRSESNTCSEWLRFRADTFGDIVVINADIPESTFTNVNALSSSRCTNTHPVACCAPVP